LNRLFDGGAAQNPVEQVLTGQDAYRHTHAISERLRDSPLKVIDPLDVCPIHTPYIHAVTSHITRCRAALLGEKANARANSIV
jgi:hypothetical protein